MQEWSDGGIVHDPLTRPGWPERRIHAVVFVALIAGAVYLIWRLVASQDGAQPLLFWLLWSAEAFGFLALILHAQETWAIPSTHRHTPIDVPVDILIPTYDEPRVVLEATFVGCARVRGNVKVWVLDDGNRDWVRALAEEFGFKVVTRSDNEHAKAGNINHALPLLGGDLMLVLDADHVPDPAIVTAMSGYFTDPKVAIVQSPHFFRNRDSAAHSDLENHEQGLFFEVIEPARDRLEASFWAGSGALVRTEALRSIGGLPTRTITEDLESTLALQRAGWRTHYHRQHLLQGLAPQNLAAYMIQRQRWAIGTLNVLFGPNSPLFRSGFRLRTRLAYCSNLAYYLFPFQRLVFTGTMVVLLWTALLPVGEIPVSLIGGWLAWTTLAVTAAYGLSRGYQRPFLGDVYMWVTASRFLLAWWSLVTRRRVGFVVTPKEGVDPGGVAALRLLRLPAACLAIVAISLIVRLAVQWHGSATGNWILPPLKPEILPIVVFFALWEIATLTRVLVHYARRRQYRTLWRFPVDLPGSLDGIACRVLDLNEFGARVVVDADLDGDGPHVLAITLEDDLLESTRTACGHLTASSRQMAPEGIMLGGTVAWEDDESRRAVIYETHVRAPFSASRSIERQLESD